MFALNEIVGLYCCFSERISIDVKFSFNTNINDLLNDLQPAHTVVRFCGVMVSTLDFESSDPSSNLGRTSETFIKRVSNEINERAINK